jgi:hypothetical protein
MKKNCLVLSIIVMVAVCIAQDCGTMPPHFVSYDAAMLFVRRADFKLKDEISIYKSSWLTHAEYYSCDGYSGIFIFRTEKGREYIMKNVPLYVWTGHKHADSYGKYYNRNIRGKYHFPL